ncbi:MAG: hypothetical protein KF901_03930 [Myxococcales bacterium]|nr:hypothetical protein [Myxococcales bacterium]
MVDEQVQASSSPGEGVKLGSYRLVARAAEVPSGTVYEARLHDAEASLVLLHPALDEEARARVLARLLGVLRAGAAGLELDVGEDGLFGTYVGCTLAASRLAEMLSAASSRALRSSATAWAEPSASSPPATLNTDLELDLPPPAPRPLAEVDEGALTTLREGASPLAPLAEGLDPAALPLPRDGGFGVGLELEIDPRGLPLPELDEPLHPPSRPPTRVDDGWRPVAAETPSATVEEVMARDPGFWPRVPVAFLVPFLGLGMLWLAALTIVPVVPLFIPFGLGFGVAGLVLRILWYLGYFGLLAVYYRQSMQVGADDDDDELSWPRPRYRMPERSDVFAQGAAMTLLGILAGLAVYATTRLPPTAALITLSAGAFVFPFYLLMALTMVLGTGRITAALDPILVVRGIVAGGLPYLAVGAAGGLTWMVASRVMGGLAESGSLVGLLFALLVGVAAPAYFFGVLGYLMGRLVAVRADRFERLFE